jgi:hypothetical protein
MPSRQYEIVTPWLRSTHTIARIVITLRVDAERHGGDVAWAFGIVNVVHEVALLPNDMIEIPDSEDDDDNAEFLPNQNQDVSFAECSGRRNDH